MREHFKRWEPVADVAFPCAGVDISNHTDELILRLMFSGVVGGGDRDLQLRLRWGFVVALATWQEFAHPWNADEVIDRIPRLNASDWMTYSFPMIEVLDSKLVTAFDEGQRAAYPRVRHFRIVTLDHTVDLLATGEPQAQWVQPLPDRLLQATSGWRSHKPLSPETERPARLTDVPHLKIAASVETEARKREVQLLINISEPDPQYQPLIVTDEAALLDVVGTDPGELSRRINTYFGRDLGLDLRLPVWRLVDHIKQLLPRWPDDPSSL